MDVSEVDDRAGLAGLSGIGRSSALSQRIVISRVTDEPLSLSTHAEAVAGPASGAVVTFAGVVRDHDDRRSVTALRYEAHPTAVDVLKRVVTSVGLAHTDVHALAASHRIGGLRIGDLALAVAVASAHRAAAFACCAELVEEIKREIPVWKQQVFVDGSSEWVNLA